MLTEIEWFKHLKTTLAPGETLLHDAYFDPSSRQVLSTDMLVEGTHFKKEWGTPFDLGYKALSVNLSDLAATAAKPQWALVSIGIPPDTPNNDIKTLYEGLKACANEYHCQIIGGDTCKSDKLVINITVLGYVPMGYAVGRRNLAQVGDLIAVSDSPGLAHLGLICCDKNLLDYPNAIKQFLRPVPQLALSNQISRLSEKLCVMDTSDGLADGLLKIAEASQKDLIIDSSLIPIHQELKDYCQKFNKDPIEIALYGGEDYGLLLCLPQALATLYEPLKVIGQVSSSQTQGKAFIKRNHHIRELHFKDCYQHFDSTDFDHLPEVAPSL